MNDNPFSIIFGIEPTRFISRESQISEIVDTFKSNTPSSYLYIITGVRGSGKTVTMASIINRLKNEKGWITITLNSNRDLLTSLAANLYEHPLLKPAFLKANISFSLGINASLSMESPSADVEVQIKKMLEIVQKLGIRVLIAIDEVTNSENDRVFASAYQMFLYEQYPVFS